MTSYVGLDTSRVPGKWTAQAYQYGVLCRSGGNCAFVIDIVEAQLLDLTGATALAFARAHF
ncbi:MAG: hypothetical protein OXR64_02315 [Chloroflexota bacterium]|nr:hypothetical protein [Chloroflexota bacterium]MDE2918662.1 hypothetical protein [Chloroflexota bacterium]